MGLFDLFQPKKLTYSQFKYNADYLEQDPSNSIVAPNGKYDMSRFSPEEDRIIKSVLYNARKKYPRKYAAIGLANESYPIMYKPRYVLFDIIIKCYEDSKLPLDQVAVAFAYSQKGAKYMSNATSYFEKVENVVDWRLVNDFASFYGVFTSFSKIYERLHDYDKAIQCMKKCAKYNKNSKSFCENRILELEEKKKNQKPYRPRKMSDEQAEFERSVSCAAEKYMTFYMSN